MAKVTELGHGTHLSISGLSLEFGMTRETIAKRLGEARIAPSGKRNGYAVYRLRDVVKALTGQNTEDGKQDPEKLKPFERQAHYKAELDRLKLEQELRELIPRIEVEQEQARAFRIVSLMLDTLPDVLERDCGLAAAHINRVERAVDEVREGLFADLTAEDDADSERA